MRLAPPPMDFFDCFLRGTSTHRPGPHHGPRSATELSSRREDVLSTSRPAVHGICDRRGRFDRRMHNKLTRDDVHCAACRDRPKLRARSHELRRGGPIIMWTSAAPDIKSNRGKHDRDCTDCNRDGGVAILRGCDRRTRSRPLARSRAVRCSGRRGAAIRISVISTSR